MIYRSLHKTEGDYLFIPPYGLLNETEKDNFMRQEIDALIIPLIIIRLMSVLLIRLNLSEDDQANASNEGIIIHITSERPIY